MRKFLSLGSILAVFAIAIGVDANATETQTLTGVYESGFQNGADPLTAVFTPTAEERWKVSFNFKFDGKNHTYKGTAEGSLSQGKLHGKVQNENRQRTFTFRGEFDEDGSFRGDHAEVRRGKSRKTGTMTLGG